MELGSREAPRSLLVQLLEDELRLALRVELDEPDEIVGDRSAVGSGHRLTDPVVLEADHLLVRVGDAAGDVAALDEDDVADADPEDLLSDGARGRGEREHRTGREPDQKLLHWCRPSVNLDEPNRVAPATARTPVQAASAGR